ncbi:hypothetical protein KAR91_71880 [Candidatus Pacearchaeota archaeon]|nr:hypothetical protein [Candidatus Pacearchaeota archaeon]
MEFKGGFRKCYIEMLDLMGRELKTDLAIIRLAEDDYYRLIDQDDLEQWNAKFCDRTMRVCLCLSYREAKVIVDGVQLPMKFGA